MRCCNIVTGGWFPYCRKWREYLHQQTFAFYAVYIQKAYNHQMIDFQLKNWSESQSCQIFERERSQWGWKIGSSGLLTHLGWKFLRCWVTFGQMEVLQCSLESRRTKEKEYVSPPIRCQMLAHFLLPPISGLSSYRRTRKKALHSKIIRCHLSLIFRRVKSIERMRIIHKCSSSPSTTYIQALY